MDESGVLMAPLVRRTWAPRGQVPLLAQRMGKREKVSVAGAIWLPPDWNSFHWFSSTLLNSYFNSQQVAAFLEKFLREVSGPLVLVWDGGPMHRGEPIRRLLANTHGQLTLEQLPPYSPELNPVEFAWSWIKYGRLCNFVPKDSQFLLSRVLGELTHLHRHPELLRSFFSAAKLRI